MINLDVYKSMPRVFSFLIITTGISMLERSCGAQLLIGPLCKHVERLYVKKRQTVYCI